MESKTRQFRKQNCSSILKGKLLITSDEALAAVLSRRLPIKIEYVNLELSLGRILADDVFADLDQPPFNRVAMDGVAINSSNLKTTALFKILKTIAAGAESPALPSGPVCYEIMTGAVLPPGSDMVIRYEDLEIKGDEARVTVNTENLPANFHPQGNDYKAGNKVLTKGTRIRSTTTAILASVGYSKVPVLSSPKLGIISTGDELVHVHEKPSPSEIRWSNGISLKHELESFGYRDVTIIKLPDSENEIRDKMKEVIAQADVLLLTGGVSAGKFDFIPKLLKECGVKEVFHNVSQRPGKPLWFGETAEGKLVFGLPGNPVSCLVNLRKFVIPNLELSLGGKLPLVPEAILTEEVKFNKNLTYYCPVKIFQEGTQLFATPIKGNGSGDFFQLRDSDGFMELRPTDAPFTQGFKGKVYQWGKN